MMLLLRDGHRHDRRRRPCPCGAAVPEMVMCLLSSALRFNTSCPERRLCAGALSSQTSNSVSEMRTCRCGACAADAAGVCAQSGANAGVVGSCCGNDGGANCCGGCDGSIRGSGGTAGTSVEELCQPKSAVGPVKIRSPFASSAGRRWRMRRLRKCMNIFVRNREAMDSSEIVGSGGGGRECCQPGAKCGAAGHCSRSACGASLGGDGGTTGASIDESSSLGGLRKETSSHMSESEPSP